MTEPAPQTDLTLLPMSAVAWESAANAVVNQVVTRAFRPSMEGSAGSALATLSLDVGGAAVALANNPEVAVDARLQAVVEGRRVVEAVAGVAAQEAARGRWWDGARRVGRTVLGILGLTLLVQFVQGVSEQR